MKEPLKSTGRLERVGLAASPGIAIGVAYVVDRRLVNIPQVEVSEAEVEGEIERFRAAVRSAGAGLDAIRAKLTHGEHRQILQAQQLMLGDPDLAAAVEGLVRRDFINVEWAVARVTDDIRETLAGADSEVFRERQSDVGFVGERLLMHLQGEGPTEIRPPPGSVVLAQELSAADTALLARSDVAAIVTAEGGPTAHSAIMARSLEIPMVVGVDCLDAVRSGDPIVVDAVHGVVVLRPSASELEKWQGDRHRYEAFEERVQRQHGLSATTEDGVRIHLRANVGLEEELASAGFHGAEGIGLYRTEYFFLERDRAPTEEEHYRHAKAVLGRMKPYAVVFRTFDLGADKSAGFLGRGGNEVNPALGMRSLRLALRERDMFLAQLRGLLRAGLHGPLRIMLPLVSGLEELRSGLEAVEEAMTQLREAGMPHAEDVPIGIMIEVPSAAVVADVLAKRVDFMSIGTNDLIQYTVAIDRENDDVGYLYRPLHPAIVRLIRQVVAAGEAEDIPVSLCGEMAADPRYTWVLAGLGVRELSMHPAAIPIIKSIVRTSTTSEMKTLADRVLGAEDADEADRIVSLAMNARFSEHILHGGGQEPRGPVTSSARSGEARWPRR